MRRMLRQAATTTSSTATSTSSVPYDPVDPALQPENLSAEQKSQHPWSLPEDAPPAVLIDSTDYNATYTALGGSPSHRRRLLQDPSLIGK
jgi:hypothetical protein